MQMKLKNQMKWNVVFCGTPQFAINSLDFLFKNPNVTILKVITPLSEPSGRGYKLKAPPVAEYAINNNIPLLQTANINHEFLELKAIHEKDTIHFFMVIAFCQFLNSDILKLPLIGCFNIHASLLPRHRGASPVQHSILYGDQKTGVTIQKMVRKMDAGDIVSFTETEIAKREYVSELFERLESLSVTTLENFFQKLTKLFNNGVLLDHAFLDSELIKQDETKVTYAPTFTKLDGLLSKQFLIAATRVEVDQKIRAFNLWPGTYLIMNGKRLKIHKCEMVSLSELPPKSIPRAGELKADKWLLLGCLDGALRLTEIQLEGKKIVMDSELIHGLRGDLFLD